MGNIALQVERTLSGQVQSGENVVFDTVSYTDGNIIYDGATGAVTFMETGRYIVNWVIVVQASSYRNGVELTFTSSNGTELRGNSNMRTGEVTGSGIVEITSAPEVFHLKNLTSGSYFYSDTVSMKATLVIISDEIDIGCLAAYQMANILSQMVLEYSTDTWSVFSTTLASYSGVPLDLYTAPDAGGPGLLRLVDINNDYEILPIANILAIYPGGGTVYNPGFTYLMPPDPLPNDCSADFLAAVQSAIPIGTDVAIFMGANISASGSVYRNEYGLMILSDDDGNTPIFIATPYISRVFAEGNLLRSSNDDKRPKIEFIGE